MSEIKKLQELLSNPKTDKSLKDSIKKRLEVLKNKKTVEK